MIRDAAYGNCRFIEHGNCYLVFRSFPVTGMSFKFNLYYIFLNAIVFLQQFRYLIHPLFYQFDSALIIHGNQGTNLYLKVIGMPGS